MGLSTTSHFQACYRQAPFAVERAPTEPIPGAVVPEGVRVTSSDKGWEGGRKRLQETNVPHNMFVVDSGHCFFIYPNAFAAAKAPGKVPESLLDTQPASKSAGTWCSSGRRTTTRPPRRASLHSWPWPPSRRTSLPRFCGPLSISGDASKAWGTWLAPGHPLLKEEEAARALLTRV
eukprot:jgi/Botrbrau1/18816/Bobra.0806s0001.1